MHTLLLFLPFYAILAAGLAVPGFHRLGSRDNKVTADAPSPILGATAPTPSSQSHHSETLIRPLLPPALAYDSGPESDEDSDYPRTDVEEDYADELKGFPSRLRDGW